MPASPQELLRRALEASLTGSPELIEEVFSEDVVVWSPNLLVSSRAELEDALADRDDALSNVEWSIDWIGAIRHKAIAEWRVAADHTGPFLIGDDLLVEGTGKRITLAGATFAEVIDGRIHSMRHYFDDAALLEQVLLD